MLHTFLRKENKYLLDNTLRRDFHRLAADQIEPDLFGRYTVCNLYYDTEDFALIRASIEKPCFKEKFRIRSYGACKGNDPVFLEIKRKYDGIVYKRRIRVPYSVADSYLRHGVHWGEENQILHELDYFTHFYELVPKVYLAYEREAFTGRDDKSLRITFDSSVRARNHALRFDTGSWGNDLMQENQCILEIKTETAYPLWLTHALTELRIYPTSFSKYGTFYIQQFNKSNHSMYNPNTMKGHKYVYNSID